VLLPVLIPSLELTQLPARVLVAVAAAGNSAGALQNCSCRPAVPVLLLQQGRLTQVARAAAVDSQTKLDSACSMLQGGSAELLLAAGSQKLTAAPKAVDHWLVCWAEQQATSNPVALKIE
jgi:hypothetical protein